MSIVTYTLNRLEHAPRAVQHNKQQQCNDNMNCMGNYLGDEFPMFGMPSRGGQQSLIQKLSVEVSQVHIPGLWPGVPGFPFPNTNSYSKA